MIFSSFFLVKSGILLPVRYQFEKQEEFMKIIEVKNRISELINCLLEVWEGSVKATHLFLSDREIKNIKEYVPQALKNVEHLVIAEDEAGCPKAFMGIEDGSLEMLFVAPEERGKGLGKRLLRYGIENYAVERLAVNEQNPQAKGFYEHMGFRVYKRTELDEHFFHSTYFADPELTGDGSGGGKMTIEKLTEVLGLITKNADVAGFTIAEYLPFDEYKLHKMFSGISLFIE